MYRVAILELKRCLLSWRHPQFWLHLRHFVGRADIPRISMKYQWSYLQNLAICDVSVLWFSVCMWWYGLCNYTNWLFPLLVFLLFFKLLIDKKRHVNFLGNVTPHRSHSDPMAVLQTKDWRGQTYLQPLLPGSEISLFWCTSCTREFFQILKAIFKRI